ncbi:hypothetical protein JCM1841_001596 [Sporobolomyces salmonicolor]
MSSRSSSPASTVRARTPSAPSHPDFLVSALSRLNLAPAPSPPRCLETLVSQSPSAASLYTLRSSPSYDDPEIWTLGSTSGDDGASRSGLMSRDEALSYAGDVAFAFATNPSHVSSGSQARKLVFYQSLLVQFALCVHEQLPASIVRCKKLLRASVRISIKQYLEVVARRGDVLSEVTQFDSTAALRRHLKKPGNHAPIKTAKAEMLQPFLVTLY